MNGFCGATDIWPLGSGRGSAASPRNAGCDGGTPRETIGSAVAGAASARASRIASEDNRFTPANIAPQPGWGAGSRPASRGSSFERSWACSPTPPTCSSLASRWPSRWASTSSWPRMGVGFPLIALVANWWGLRKNDEVALTLARRWSHVMAILFAVGAVTGTVLSFEMGLLWPGPDGPLRRRLSASRSRSRGSSSSPRRSSSPSTSTAGSGWSPRAHLLSGDPDRDCGLRRRPERRGRELVDRPARRVHLRRGHQQGDRTSSRST